MVGVAQLKKVGDMTAGLQLFICTYEESMYDGAELKGIQASETSGQYCYSVFLS